jgi:hypothetical protein
MSEDEFMALNHRRFTILHRRQRRLRWQQEYLQGCTTSAIYMMGFARPKNVPKPDDFCFTLKPGERSRKKPQTRQEVADVFRSLFATARNGKKGGSK